MKVELVRSKQPERDCANDRLRRILITKSLPWFRSDKGVLIHRIRTAHVYTYDEEFSHIGVTYWCANIGSISKKRPGSMLAILPEKCVLCATCEGRAIGAGMDGAREINGRNVLYSPRL